MNLRSILLLLALVLLAAFALVNWQAFMAPTHISLLVTEVQAPLGLIMLLATAAVTALLLVYIVFQQAGVIVEARRYARDLKSQRELADKAEASRFTELRAWLEAELRRLDARLDQLDAGLHEALAESTRTLSAYVGEVDDKLDRALPPPS
jgi:uncharacterized integral membrane protein